MPARGQARGARQSVLGSVRRATNTPALVFCFLGNYHSTKTHAACAEHRGLAAGGVDVAKRLLRAEGEELMELPKATDEGA